MDKVLLFVGNRNYSSWSLRPWLVLKWSGLPFAEQLINLDQPGYGESKIAEILAVSPSGKVPALQVGATAIWDSLAISEWVADAAPAAQLWPANVLHRAVARAVTAEMHSGFTGIRRDLSMNIRRRTKAKGLPLETLADIARIDHLWTETRQGYGAAGSYLFGHRTIADAFFTPVATRFRTYGIGLSDGAQAYCDTLLGDDGFVVWEQKVLAEPATRFSRAKIDDLYAD
jgi:glutathione S-transferase